MSAGYQNNYRPDVDGLRALAVLLVIGFHAGPARVPGGFIGVDVFFVISGYLITGILLRNAQHGTLSLIDFYAGRFRRIVPALALVLAATWVFGWVTFTAEEFRNLGRHLLAGATFTSNLLLWREVGYFDGPAEFKPLVHLWSLGVEEQFYLLWPFLLAALLKRRMPVFQITFCLLILSFALNLLIIGNHAAAAFYLLPTRFWELMSGAVLAYVEITNAAATRSSPTCDLRSQVEKRKRLLNNICAAAGLVLILFSSFGFDSKILYPGWFASAPVFGSVLLIRAGPNAWLNRRVFSRKLLVTLGLISYPLYLWHWVFLSIAHIICSGVPTRAVRLCAVAISLVLAYLTWRLVEKPIRKKFNRFPVNRGRASIAIASGVSILLSIGLVGIATEYEQGFAFRWQMPADFVDRQTKDLSDSNIQREITLHPVCADLLKNGKRLDFCHQTNPASPTIALFGDSHAQALFPGFAQALSIRGLGTPLLIGQNGCAPMLGVRVHLKGVPDACLESNKLALEIILTSPSIQNVILVSRGPIYVTGKGFGVSQNWLDLLLEPEATEDAPRPTNLLFKEGTSSMISALEVTGKRVIFMIDTPELGFLPQECIDRPMKKLFVELRQPCAVAYQDVKTRQSEYRRIIGELAAKHPKIQVFDASKTLCDANFCSAIVDGHMLYRDGDHLSSFGSEFFGKALSDFYANAGGLTARGK